jgi:CBS-domain-containing membrane protein
MDSLRVFGRCKLLVHSRRVHTPRGEQLEEPVVLCPRRSGATTLAHCVECREYNGRSFDADSRRSFVMCGGLETEPHPMANTGTLTAEIMSPSVICVEAAMLREVLAALLVREGITSVPVVDKDRRVLGIVSSNDLLRSTDNRSTAAQLMTPCALTVSPRTRVEEVATLLANERTQQLPVVSDDERLVGMITALEVAQSQAHDPLSTTRGTTTMTDPKRHSAARIRAAFHSIDRARQRQPGVPLREIIDHARQELHLTDVELQWIHWTLAPDELAVQPKEPQYTR